MAIRVPLLLEIVDAVVHRLDTTATRLDNPQGLAPQGYDDVFREPVVTDPDSGSSVDSRVSSRKEHPPIRVPCQVETTLFENLQMSFAGNMPSTRMTLVFHREHLLALGLLDPTTKNCIIQTGDRVSQLEQYNLGVPTLVFEQPGLFVTEVTPASWGFGPDGHDLHLVILERRDQGAR